MFFSSSILRSELFDPWYPGENNRFLESLGQRIGSCALSWISSHADQFLLRVLGVTQGMSDHGDADLIHSSGNALRIETCPVPCISRAKRILLYIQHGFLAEHDLVTN